MINLNRAMVLGNATRDPELRTTPSGRSVANFAVATNRRWTDKDGEQREEVEFHEIVTWGKLAEIASQIIQKGTKVYAEGRLRTRTWEGQDGARREKTEIIASNVISLSPRSQAPGDETPADASEKPGKKEDEEDKKEQSKAEKSKDKTGDNNPDEEINLDDIPF